MEQIAAELAPEQGERLVSHITQIYEACTFQDITGQRIKKVVGTLREIEMRVDAIMEALGDKVGLKPQSSERLEKKVSVEDEMSLLNGPQMKDKAVTQEEIDRLLAEFDN